MRVVKEYQNVQQKQPLERDVFVDHFFNHAQFRTELDREVAQIMSRVRKGIEGERGALQRCSMQRPFGIFPYDRPDSSAEKNRKRSLSPMGSFLNTYLNEHGLRYNPAQPRWLKSQNWNCSFQWTPMLEELNTRVAEQVRDALQPKIEGAFPEFDVTVRRWNQVLRMHAKAETTSTCFGKSVKHNHYKGALFYIHLNRKPGMASPQLEGVTPDAPSAPPAAQAQGAPVEMVAVPPVEFGDFHGFE